MSEQLPLDLQIPEQYLTGNGGHGLLSPSRAPKFMNCHAWLVRQPAPGAIEEDTTAADWGTDAHAYLEKGLHLGIDPVYLTEDQEGDEREKAEVASVAYGYAVFVVGGSGPASVRPEVAVSPFPGDMDSLTRGSADLVICRVDELEVADLKSGFKVVEPTSEQLQAYLLGALNDYWPDRTLPCPFKTFKTTIIQPRARHKAGPVRSMTYELQDVLAFEERALQAVHANLRGDAPATPGAHCKYCSAKKVGTCSEYLSWAAQVGIPASLGPVTEKSLQDMLAKNTLQGLPAEELGHMKDMLPTLKTLADEVDKEVKARLKKGVAIPGWKLGKVEGRPKWLNQEADLRKMFRALGMKPMQYENKSLRTPLQVMKAKKITEEQSEGVSQLWSRGDPVYKVVEDTHPAANSTAWMRTIPNFNEETKV